MTRAERVVQVNRLLALGYTHARVAAEVGISVQHVSGIVCDPDGAKQRARREGYRGRCEVCGKPTDGSNGSAAAPARCAACFTRRQHEERVWTAERIVAVFQEFARVNGRPPTASDVNIGCPTIRARHTPARIAESELFLARVPLPGLDTVRREFGGWTAAIEAAGFAPAARGRRPRARVAA